MSVQRELLSFLQQVRVLPRRLVLETAGVEATIPMLRGVWGAALHGLDPRAYRAVFSPDGQGPHAIPGYLLRPVPAGPQADAALDWFLLGDAPEYDGTLQRAWEVASRMGLGPNRRPFRIRQCQGLRPDGTVTDSPRPWPVSEAAWPLEGPPETTPCRLQFPTPLRLLRRDQLISTPTPADLVVAAVRRVAALLPDADRAAWEQLKPQLLEAARGCPASPWHGRRLDLVRYSARQDADLNLRGVAGSLDLPHGPGDLWPLLAAAQWLHLGKSTVMGLGQVIILPLCESPPGERGA